MGTVADAARSILDAPFTVCGTSEDREAWLALRRHGIGSSEAAAIHGDHEWLSALALYLDKQGLTAPKRFDEDLLETGLLMEPVIAEKYRRKTGREVQLADQLLVSRRHGILCATLDAWTVHPTWGRIPLELKWVEWGHARWQTGIPEQYVWQVRHQAIVTGRPGGCVAALLNGKLVWDDVALDPRTADMHIAACLEMWRRIENGEPPAADGSESATAGLSILHPKDGGGTIALDNDALGWTQRIEEIDALDEERDSLRNKIREAIGSASRGMLPGEHGGWTWRADKGGKRSLRRF